VSDANDKVAKQLKVTNVSGKAVSSVLPYPQRRKMALGESSQEVQVNDYFTDKKPPTAPKQTLAEKYKVTPIPSFRGASHQNGPKIDLDVTLSPQTSPKKNDRKQLPSPGNDRNRPPLAQSNKRINFQDVINPSLPPPPPPTFSPQKDSPESAGFHIRCNSQTSISSLGSNAVDSIKGEKHGQQQHLYKMQPQGYPQMHPPNYYHGYMQQPPQHIMPHYQNVPNPKPGVAGFGGDVFSDVLGQDIATFLHGERIAAQTNPNALHPTNHMSQYWNPGYGAWGHPYQHHIPQLNPEPLPPPLTPVPNMELRRARLPSISDDDWTEELGKINEKDDDKNAVSKKREQPSKNEWNHRMGQQQQNFYPNQQHFPYPNIQGYYNQHQMAGYYNQNQIIPPPDRRQYRNDGRKSPNERSSLLDQSGNRNYLNYNGDRVGNGNSNKAYRDEGERRRKKKKSSRRREKSRRMQASESSEEDESERRSARSRKSNKSRRYRRKKRDGILDDTMSDTMSESMMTQSLADHSVSKEIQGGLCTRLVVSTKLLICNLPFSASAISLSIVLLGTLWFKWAEEILTSCKEVTFHSSQCSLPDFPGEFCIQ
jgi:hypothetical protein